MNYVVRTDVPPIREDESGALRVGNTRVLLEFVIKEFEDGATPEAIIQQFPSLLLSDVYAVIAYYLKHRDEIGGYIAERDRLGDSVQHRIEAGQPDLAEIRRRLNAARSK